MSSVLHDVGALRTQIVDDLLDALRELSRVLAELLAVVAEFQLPDWCPVWFHSPDNGPGQGIRYIAVIIRNNEMIIILRLDKFNFGAAEPGASHKNEAEQPHSHFLDSCLVPIPRPGFTCTQFCNLTKEEMCTKDFDVSTLSDVAAAAIRQVFC
jgi:hypothetical protein